MAVVASSDFLDSSKSRSTNCRSIALPPKLKKNRSSGCPVCLCNMARHSRSFSSLQNMSLCLSETRRNEEGDDTNVRVVSLTDERTLAAPTVR